MESPLSRRQVLKFGAFTTVGGVLTPGVTLAQAITTDTRGITARDIELNVGGTKIPAYDARPERAGRYTIIVAISGFTGLSTPILMRPVSTPSALPTSSRCRCSVSMARPTPALPPTT